MILRELHARVLAGVLALIGAVLLATAVPAPFSIDEASYTATITGLRDGGLSVGATAGMPASQELLGFDANPRSRSVTSTPVASSSPPLYAPIALPFALGGEYGLIALQILSFLACAAVVFAFVRRETARVELAWLACGAYVLAGFSLEYAQGIWPQALAQLLAMGALDLASRARRGGPVWLAAAAGACAGLAAGIRYQDAVLIAAIGAGLVLAARRRRSLLAFALGCAVPLAASGAMNHARYGSWNPISKGGGYLQVSDERTDSSGMAWQAIASTYSRVVDYATWPTASPGMAKDARTGAITLGGGIKKALLQSAPWALVPLLALLLAAVRRRRFAPEVRRELLAIGAVVGAVLGMFAIYGYRRYDGWCFNQRYLLELVPVLAAGLALALKDTPLSLRALGVGAGVACAIGLLLLLRVDDEVARGLVALRLPLGLAAAAAAAWVVALRGGRRRLLGAALGAALGWSVAAHLGDDLPAARGIRSANAERLAAMRAALPDRPALVFAYWGAKDPYGTLPLHLDLLVVDPWIDEGKTARPVADAALADGRAVYVLLPMPRDVMIALATRRHVVTIDARLGLLEVRP